MLSIRFLRSGKKNQPFFRIVVVDSRKSSTGGRFLEILGFYNPLTKERKANEERIKYWLSVGAKPSDTVHNLLIKEGLIKEDKIAVHSTKKSKKNAEKEAKKAKEAPKEAVGQVPVGEEPVKQESTPVPESVGSELAAKEKPPATEEQKPEAPVDSEPVSEEVQKEEPVNPEEIKEEQSEIETTSPEEEKEETKEEIVKEEDKTEEKKEAEGQPQ